MLRAVRHIVLNIIDFFHKPFGRWIDKTTFRYLACGGSNQVLYLLLYSISYNFVLHKQDTHLLGMPVSARIGAYLISFTVSFPVGFILSRYIVFPGSELHGRVQFFRYGLLTAICILLTYIFLKFFAWCHFYPTPAAALTSIIIAVFSYLTQKHFTFKAGQEVAIAGEGVE